MLNNAPHKWTIEALEMEIRCPTAQTEVGGGYWQIARPYGFFSLSSRFRLAWAVFTGEADALFWPQQRAPRAY